MNIKKINTEFGKVPTWGDDDFDESVHANFVSLKEMVPQLNTSIDDINAVVDNLNGQFGTLDNSIEVVTQLKIDTLAAKDEATFAKNAAIAAKNLAETIYDNFDDRYLGTHPTEPTVDNDGNALRDGALYHRNSKIYVYDLLGAKWVDMMYIPTLLSSLSDIVFGSKTNNDVIQYDSTLGKWVNRRFYSKNELDTYLLELETKLDNMVQLVSGLTIKTINSQDLRGSGNITINGAITPLNLGSSTLIIKKGIQTSIPILNFSDFTTLKIKCTLVTDTGYIPISASLSGSNIIFTADVLNVKYLLVEHSASNFSSVGIKSYEATVIAYRYYRLRNIIGGANQAVPELRFYTAANGGGTKYPSDMTSATTPAPFAVTASYNYNDSYAGWKALDNSTTTLWWLLSGTNISSQWLQIDMGTSISFLSFSFTCYPGNTDYLMQTFDIVASNSSAFAGEEVKLGTFSVVGLAAGQTKIFNL